MTVLMYKKIYRHSKYRKIIEASFFFFKNIINIQTFAKNNLEQAVLRNHFELQFFKNTLENIFSE